MTDVELDPVALAVMEGLVPVELARQARFAASALNPPMSPLQLLLRWGVLQPDQADRLRGAREAGGRLPDLSQRYRKLGLLGRGGQATVFAALDLHLMREVAIKLARPRPVAQARLLREGHLLASLGHPNLVRVLSRGTLAGRHALVLERVEGRTLSELCEERGPLPWEEAAAVLDGVLAGVGHAHERGVVHNDLKPSNVMVEPSGRVRVIDFGLCSRLGGETLARPGKILGTPAYLSPERIQEGQRASAPAGDVFAAGVMLYKALAGQVPFAGCGRDETLVRVLEDTPRPLRELVPELPEEVEAVVSRALEKRPALRFADALAMRSALAEAVAATKARADVTPTEARPRLRRRSLLRRCAARR